MRSVQLVTLCLVSSLSPPSSGFPTGDPSPETGPISKIIRGTDSENRYLNKPHPGILAIAKLISECRNQALMEYRRKADIYADIIRQIHDIEKGMFRSDSVGLPGEDDDIAAIAAPELKVFIFNEICDAFYL